MPVRTIDSPEEMKSLVGQEVAVSDWMEIDQQRINAFADVTGDHQWIHIDVDRAKAESPFKTPIAHGFLTLSMMSQFLHSTIRLNLKARLGVNYGCNKVRFTGPVPAGSRIRARFNLQSFKEIEGGYENVWLVTIEVEGREKPALVAEWIGRGYL